ncbi:MAG TPA: hypothetical protein VJ247_02655, partial [Gaiella sp.]|nr:hypothetical protein [Gaiella sp.]
MCRVVRRDDDAESAQIFRRSGVRVTSRDGHVPSQEELRERAHPRAGDANEMNRARIAWVEKGHASKNTRSSA